jgi:hypothetical protein
LGLLHRGGTVNEGKGFAVVIVLLVVFIPIAVWM